MTKKDEIREAAETSLETFIRLVHPNRVLGHIHQQWINWWERAEAKTHQLLLAPRDHQKSAMIGYRTAHKIIKNPAVRILYISSTSNLAIKQLKFIKDILTCDIVRFYWPELVLLEEAKREKWTETEISVDHPLRRAENVRDPTVFTAGLTTTITGLHADVQVLDDVVVKENAYTEEGRQKVEEQYSLLASVGSGEFEQWVVGTRYHPKDLYETLLSAKYDVYDENGDVQETEHLYEVFGDDKQRQVEDRGDGTGTFLWPRQQRPDGKWFGFDAKILAKKRAQYLDRVQYFAQYYNNPNDPSGSGFDRSIFQYYDRKFLSGSNGTWYFRGQRLNIFAAIDFAYSLSKRADFTSIVVVGVDPQQNYYVLDIDRFKAGLPSEYFEHLLRLYQKWGFRKLRAEVTAAQQVIVNTLKTEYITKYGLALSVEDYRPSRDQGTKEERIYAILQPRYEARQIWHFQGGMCELLEEELILNNPAHDDIKDALSSCIEICIAPAYRRAMPRQSQLTFNSRFGGVQ